MLSESFDDIRVYVQLGGMICGADGQSCEKVSVVLCTPDSLEVGGQSLILNCYTWSSISYRLVNLPEKSTSGQALFQGLNEKVMFSVV